MLRVLRAGNTALDRLFYDVDEVDAELRRDGLVLISAARAPTPGNPVSNQASGRLDLSAPHNPEGSIIVVASMAAPHVRIFADVPHFLGEPKHGAETIETISITGVGSSTLGSVAFSWDLSTAPGQRVAAIVPGYGLADAVQQSLSGRFGFGLYG